MRKKLSNLWHNFVHSGIETPLSPREYTRMLFFNIGSLLGLIVCSYYLLIEYGRSSSQFFVVAFVASFLLINLVLLRYTKSFILIIRLVLPVIFAAQVINLVNGGSGGTGIFWITTIPVIAFFLEGKKAGLFWSISFIFLAWMLIHLDRIGLVDVVYPYSMVSQSLIALAVLMLLMYCYESISEKYFTLVSKQKEELEALTNDLKKQVSENEASGLALAENIKQIEKQNQALQDTKIAMLNVLEDEKQLEKELRIEKSSVEKKVEERTLELKKETDELSAANKTIEESIVELSREKSRLDASIGSLSVGFVMTDKDNFVFAINKKAEGILGKGKQFLSLSDIELVTKDSFSLLRLVTEVKTTKVTKEIPELNFGERILRLFVSPILVESGKEDYLGTVFLLEDITEKVIATRSKEEFFSIASHEFRTPLASIRGYSALLGEDYSKKLNDKNFDQMLLRIHDSSLRLIEIIDDFLAVSMLEQDKVIIKKTKFKLDQLVKEIFKECEETATASKTKLKLFGKDLLISSDRGRVATILRNLVSNSLKFAPGGQVTVRVKKANQKVIIQVSDTGKGIARENQKLLFRKFQQAEDSTLTRTANRAIGIGLYICKLNAQKLGGEICLVKSEVNKGSTFELSLPG